MGQRIGCPSGVLMHQSHEYWVRSNGNHSTNRNEQIRISTPRIERVTHLEFLYLIFPAGPETRPAMYEKDRIRGVRVGDINILYRAENRIKR